MRGPPMYFTIGWQAAGASVAALEPEELALSFHGRPMRGPKMRGALHSLAARFGEVAVPRQGRHVAAPRRAGDGSGCETP